MKTKGAIVKRTISGKEYYSYKYLIDGKQANESLSEAEAYRLSFQLGFQGEDIASFLEHEFNLEVSYGEMLYRLGKPYRNFKKRFCYFDIKEYLSSHYPGKALVLYGLRRTGKTTLMFQSINDIPLKEFGKVAYIKCGNDNTIFQLLNDLRYLAKNGFEYIYIDEVTLLEGFVRLSSTISDIYGVMGKVIMSGTDSLGFSIASHQELYDRVKMVHTTYISFKEFSSVLGIKSIDTYIEYGGTMSIEGVDYNHTVNSNGNLLNEYVDSSIIHNIIHSLKIVEDGKYFFHLRDLYDRHELENAINRIIEDNNHRFAISVIERDFKSHDYGSLKQLLSLPRNYEKFGDILEGVDEKRLLEDLMDALNIINKEKQTYRVDETVLIELMEYLKELDVIAMVDEVSYPTFDIQKRAIFTQPGLRYAQAKTLVDILLNDKKMKQYDAKILLAIKEKLLSDVKGRMVEDIILYENAIKSKASFKFYFGYRGEYDMVTLHPEDNASDIYEIKYSTYEDANQYKHLIDTELNGIFEKKYYPIKNRIVLYRGKNKMLENGITYLNIEEFLQN